MAERVLIALSGGVDSSVAAWLLRQQGYECVGVTMRLHEEKGHDDAADAAAVAQRLGIPFHVLDFRAEFDRRVKAYFARSYEMGHTPNPCYECNRHLKFGALMDAAADLGCDYLATGHYARITKLPGGRMALEKGADPARDQSYFLACLGQEQLRRILFPLADVPKDEVRRIAARQGLVTARKRDSQDICFVPDGDYVGFLERYSGKTYPTGPIRHLDGRELGRHKGAVRYTLGQRKGLGIGGGEVVYVCGKSMAENAVYVGPESALFSRRLVAGDLCWGAAEPFEGPTRVKARVRYRHAEQDATAKLLPDGHLEVVFDEPQRAITTGQTLVLYGGDTVLLGGTIEETGDREA